MIAEIAARHGVRLDPDDPAFLLVELNLMALDEKEAKLKAQTDEAENNLTGLIGFLQKAGDVYQEQIKAYTNAQGETIRAQMEKDANTAKARFDRDSHDAIRAALTEVERVVKSTVQTEISAPVKKLLRAQDQNIWKTLALCFVCGLIGGLAVLSANAFTHDKQQEAYTELGKAVAASWDKLDNKARTAINTERVQ